MSSVIKKRISTDPAQLEVLASMEPFVNGEITAHLERRNLWFPNELLPSEQDDNAELNETREAARGLPDTVRVALAINLLTEEGLPHFHRLIAVYMGNDSPWSTWNNMWTAEEDRHGCALRDYVRDARIFDLDALERLQYAYVEAGFNPDWEHDPYRLLAYTSLQERATQAAHANTGRTCGHYEPRIQRILAHISGDEARHYKFYRNVFGEVLKLDPDRALYALERVMPALAMPGHTIPCYDQMSEVMSRADIYGPRHYQRIVEELLKFWGIGEIGGLTTQGRQSQTKLMKIPARLKRMADYMEAKAGTRDFRFDFIGNRTISL